MRNIFMRCAFLGSSYHGFQIQPNALSVQEVLEKTLGKITNEKISVIGCSRTDAGVHANDFCFNFKTECKIPISGLLSAANSFLPKDIAIKEVAEKDEFFHSRYDTIKKEYVYIVYTSKTKNPFLAERALHYPYDINVELLNFAAKAFIGTHDFSAFSSTGREYKTTVREIYDFSVTEADGKVVFKVSGNGFLYNMVRIMVGTLLEVNEGKIPPDKIPEIIEKNDRSLSGRTVSGEGLYLNQVIY